MAVAAGAVAVVGMASIAGAPAAWVLALRILVAGSSRVASPLMGEAVIGSILVWSVSIIHERPSAGLGAAFLLIAVGQSSGRP